MFKDRAHAARELLGYLEKFKNDPSAVVLGIPRGGVALARIIADGLGLPLDVLTVRKIGAPGNPEVAIGAVDENGNRTFLTDVAASYGIDDKYIDSAAEKAQREASRRAVRYRAGREPASFAGKTVIIVDDGIAMGATMRAAVQSARSKGAARIVLAVPVAAPEALAVLSADTDEIIYVAAPEDFAAVGQFYQDFPQLTDDDVVSLLAKRTTRRGT